MNTQLYDHRIGAPAPGANPRADEPGGHPCLAGAVGRPPSVRIPAGYWQGRQWLSGFHGSVGTLIVTAGFRRRLGRQPLLGASDQGTQGQRHRAGQAATGQPGPLDWLAEQTPQGGVVAVDGAVMAVASARTLGGKLEERGARLRTDIDLLSEVWSDRPSLPNEPIYQHLPPQATVSRGEKLAKLRETLAGTRCRLALHRHPR